jgi:hypothetical protein
VVISASDLYYRVSGYLGNTIRFTGPAIACGDPEACVAPFDVTVNTNNLPLLALIAYKCFTLSQNSWLIESFVINPWIGRAVKGQDERQKDGALDNPPNPKREVCLIFA